MTERLKSQQQHTIPRWLLENFTDRHGMLHVARSTPRQYFESRPRNVFRRRDYYAVKDLGASLEAMVTGLETLFHPYVKNVVRAARRGINDGDLSGMEAVAEDVRFCGLFAIHLGYRSPQWLGEDYFSGLDALRIEVEKAGGDMRSAIGEESMRLWQVGEVIVVLSQVKTPTFVMGDCGPFVSRDSELGVDNGRRKRDDPDWVPAEQRIWMALCPHVALGVAIREEGVTGLDAIPDTKRSADWVDHFNELCATHSSMIAGASRTSVCAASQRAWPID